MHWTERSRAVVAVGEELQRRGWTLYGYHEDQSDPMTDYYSPATWNGVATKGDVVVGVDVSPFTTERSGKEEQRIKLTAGEPCPECGGTGVCPDGLTYEEAKQNPRAQHSITHCAKDGGRLLLPDVVSPLHYHGVGPSSNETRNPSAPYGAPKCLYCGGRGYQLKQEPYVAFTWPRFHATPKGRTWHVERDGRIVDGGVGLQGCADYNQTRRAEAVRAFCDRLERAAHTLPHVELKPSAGTTSPTGSGASATRSQTVVAQGTIEGGITYTVYTEGTWTWIRFSGKPSETLREQLKHAGGRWGKQRREWGFKYAPVNLAALGLNGPPDPVGQPAVAVPESGAQPDRLVGQTAAGAPESSEPPGRLVGQPLAPAGLVEAEPASAPGPDLDLIDDVLAGIVPPPANPIPPGQDAGDYGLTELDCPNCGLVFHSMVGSHAAVPDPARCPRCGTLGVPRQSASDYRPAELGCPNCGQTFQGLVGQRAPTHQSAYCPRCGTKGTVLDDPEPPPLTDEAGYGLAEFDCPCCRRIFQGLTGPEVPSHLARCPSCGAQGTNPRPLDLPREWLGHGEAIVTLMRRLAADEALRARMQNAPANARLAFDVCVDDLLAEFADTYWEFYKLLVEQPAIIAQLLAWLFQWYYPAAQSDSLAKTCQKVAEPCQEMANTCQEVVNSCQEMANVCQTGPGSGREASDPLDRVMASMEAPAPQPASEPPGAEADPDPLARLMANLADPAAHPADEPPAAAETPDLVDQIVANMMAPADGQANGLHGTVIPSRPGLPWSPSLKHQPALTVPAQPLQVAARPVLTSTGQFSMFDG